MRPVDPPDLSDIRAARARIAGLAVRTPLIPLEVPGTEVHLKLENLQPIGSFKLRGAANAMLSVDRSVLERGVVTASAGNMAQGVAWVARRLEIPCRVIVPESAPRTKLDAVSRMGAEIIKVPFETWWEAIRNHGHPGAEGFFIHPVSDPSVIAGNGTIGLEILEDLPEVDTVLVPYGGGGLSSGIAIAMRALKPEIRIIACEVETAAPLAASLEAGSPQTVNHRPSFVDGIGGKSVLDEMWPMVRELLDGSIVVTLDEVASALRILIERGRVIAEGAGAVPVAAVLAGKAAGGKMVCVVSGGNIDIHKLVEVIGEDR